MREEITRDNDRIVIETRSFKNAKFLDFRVYYYNERQDQYLPTKNGFTIKDAADFEFLYRALHEKHDEIVNYLKKV